MSAATRPLPSTSAEWVTWAEARLAPVTGSPRLEAELLLAESAGVGRASVIAHPERRLALRQASRLRAMVARRGRGEPLAYILESREFFSLPLLIRPGVLVPRPETETLVEAALERLNGTGRRVLDLGTGSGAIALALKHALPDIDVTAVDCDEAALEVARVNAKQLGVSVRWLRSDWFSAVSGQRFDLIVSNPPYVASAELCLDSALAWEPRVALDGGPDGLDASRAILRDAGAHLAAGGWLLIEHGYDQREPLANLAAEAGLQLESGIDDLAGRPRVACLCEREP